MSVHCSIIIVVVLPSGSTLPRSFRLLFLSPLFSLPFIDTRDALFPFHVRLVCVDPAVPKVLAQASRRCRLLAYRTAMTKLSAYHHDYN